MRTAAAMTVSGSSRIAVALRIGTEGFRTGPWLEDGKALVLRHSRSLSLSMIVVTLRG